MDVDLDLDVDLDRLWLVHVQVSQPQGMNLISPKDAGW